MLIKDFNKMMFDKICDLTLKDPKLVYYIDMDDYELEVDFKEIRDTDNGLDKNHIGYESYKELVFLNKEIDQKDDNEITVSYHSLPSYIYDENYSLLFDYGLEYNKYYKLIIKDRVVINFDFFDSLHELEFKMETGIECLDSDETLYKYALKVKTLLHKPYIELPNGEQVFDENIYQECLNDLLEAYNEFINYINKYNSDSLLIEDCFEPALREKEKYNNSSNFTKGDFCAIRNGISQPILNKGANYYTVGDYEPAYKYYLAAALLGDEQAISNLGYCYMYGRSVEKNMDLALTCFNIAASNRNVDANYKLATIYRYDRNYKDPDLAKEYFIKAAKYLKYNERDFKDYPSLALALAREKMSGELLVKDIYGAYILLLFAYDGYEEDMKQGFTPHEKQFNDTITLLNNEIFDDAKKKYRENYKYSYQFGDYELTEEDYTNEDTILIGDKVVLIYFEYYVDYIDGLEPDDELIEMEGWLKPGMVGEVTKIFNDSYEILFYNGPKTIYKQNVRKVK